MAKIDVAQIEGYENMTPEQKIAALTAFEYEDNSGELERLKNANSKANSEAAEWKRKHNALLTEEEKKKAEQSEELDLLRQQLAEMKEEKTVSEYVAQYTAMGYDETLAKETAKAMVSGDTAKVFANQKKFLETHDKEFKASLLKGNPKPPAGQGDKTMTLDKLRKLSPAERLQFSTEHPDEYKQLYSGNQNE